MKFKILIFVVLSIFSPSWSYTGSAFAFEFQNQLTVLASTQLIVGVDPEDEHFKRTRCRTKPPEVNLAFMDRSVRPGDDFYRFANGRWLINGRIRQNLPNAGNFREARNSINSDVSEIAQDLVDGKYSNIPGASDLKIFNQSVRNVKSVEVLGLSPFQNDFDAIDNARNHNELIAYISDKTLFTNPFLQAFVGSNQLQVNENIIFITARGLGLGTRYFYEDRKETVKIRRAYKEMLAILLQELDVSYADNLSEDVYQFEKKIAGYVNDSVERRKLFAEGREPISLAQLQSDVPQIDWTRFLHSLSYPVDHKISILSKGALKEASILYHATDLDVLKAYLKIHILLDNGFALSKKIERKIGAVLAMRSGQKYTRVNGRYRAANFIQSWFPDIISMVYLENYFSKDQRDIVEQMVSSIKQVAEEKISQSAVFSDETKTVALKKIQKLRINIGPAVRDYIPFDDTLYPDRLMDNIKILRQRRNMTDIEQLVSPDARKDRTTPSTTINAFYNLSKNEILISAGIAKRPFLRVRQGDMASNYGALGAIIAHELSHAFDDSGSRFDEKGLVRNWWQKEDRARFNAISDRLIDQFSRYEIEPGTPVDGRRTLGENISDLMGLELAYSAFKENQSRQRKICGFNDDERFFLAYAQTFRIKWRDDTKKAILSVDSHSPEEFRVNGVLRNMDSWYEVFDIKTDDKYYLPPDQRLKFW